MIFTHRETGLQVIVRATEHRLEYRNAITGKDHEYVLRVELCTDTGQPVEPDPHWDTEKPCELLSVSVHTGIGRVDMIRHDISDGRD